MTKSLVVNPDEVRAKGVITTPDIPVNQYKPNFAAELETHGKDGLVDILHDMIAVRQRGYLTLGYDHRLVDGAVADEFMSKVKATIESWA